MRRIPFALAFTLIAILSPAALKARAADRKPNIVFILADDLGWRDLGCFGSTFYETPNLDALAKQGMRFTNAYAACCVCSPTRASILTGKYPARLHLTDWLPGRPDLPNQKLLRPDILQHLPLKEVTLAEALKEGGYATCFIGKWHLGGPPYYPDKQGFDINIGGCELGHPPTYFSPYRIPTLKDGPPGEYLTDRLTNEAVKFIDEHKDKPFLLYLSHYAVHNPTQAKQEMIRKYREKAAALPPIAHEFIPDYGINVRQRQDVPVYAAMVESLDQGVGRVLRALTDAGLDENTIVVFMSDNGGLSTAEGSPTSNVPLRDGKGWNYEGGIREPMIVRWPGVTRAGSTCDTPVISTDFYPTFLEMTGQPLRPEQHQDGTSIVPLLNGRSLSPRALYWHYPHYSNQCVAKAGDAGPGGAVRDGDFKLIEWYADGRDELYNLKDDPSETTDLSKKLPDKTAELREKLHAWLKSVDAQMPTRNPDYDPNWVPKPPQHPGKHKPGPSTRPAHPKGQAAGVYPTPVALGPFDDD